MNAQITGYMLGLPVELVVADFKATSRTDLKRRTMNFLRHEATNYNELIEAARAQYDCHELPQEVYEEIRDAVDAAIMAEWPTLDEALSAKWRATAPTRWRETIHRDSRQSPRSDEHP